MVFQETSQFPFVVGFDIFQFSFDCSLILIRKKVFQLRSIMVPVAAKNAIQVVRQAWVGMHEPTTEGDAVCFVVEFFRVNVVEGFQLRILQDLSVKSGNPIYTVSIMDIHVGHMYAIILINDLNSWIFVFSTNTAVQFQNNWNQMRDHFLQEFKWPFFKGFCKNGVVGISCHATDNIDSFIHIDTTIC